MEENAKALLYHEKVLENLQKKLPSNHPDLATSYNNIDLVYNNTPRHFYITRKHLTFNKKISVLIIHYYFYLTTIWESTQKHFFLPKTT
jgi:hypothetical protein